MNISIARGGAVIGAYHITEIPKLIESGVIKVTDNYWYEGLSYWRCVSETYNKETAIKDFEKLVVELRVEKPTEQTRSKDRIMSYSRDVDRIANETDEKSFPAFDNTIGIQATVVKCVSCNTNLRIRLDNGIAKCPECETVYEVNCISKTPFIYTIYLKPHILIKEKIVERIKTYPFAVVKALELLGFEEIPGRQELKKRYREMMIMYHPDKVASLGSELKDIARQKTAEINEALEIVEKYIV